MVVRIAETYVKVDNAFSPIHSLDDITSESKKSKARLLFKVFQTSPNFYPLSPNKLGFLTYKTKCTTVSIAYRYHDEPNRYQPDSHRNTRHVP
ncbi:hypothetical protein HanXRQr2_Chr08g0336361 [Helianthus annuus]|uniref:Uncharacterized protein n=1 Tax=Helianthus annuus TaxID=4232 RepID=A0A251U5Q2_HELAN|nr:hypothetical protein HanXRQr2_Chr08g0336361 [Helianthus annuus]KAJ0546633.1 hypothetical protein HanIR_Chr08g0363131 [Helianthus annuus]KAJ0901407.1 hypothetical protein HanPSC8_Chr08g0324981 [Helianthus annuus]